jgi:hypothetical protein
LEFEFWILILSLMPTDPKVIEADAVVLPPEGTSTRASTAKGKDKGEEAQNASEVSRIVALWMDELIRIPGTNIRIGLDPIIGLFPGVGDFLASSVGLVTVTEGVRTGVPVAVLFRMAFNVLINDAIGTIPGIGDVFSAFFKSNSRNLKLINQWKAGNEAAVRRSGRVFLAVFLVFWLGLLLFWIMLWFTLAATVFAALKSVFG